MDRHKHRLIYLLLVGFCIVPELVGQELKPAGLTVNFLLHPDQVYLGGYPINIPLEEAVNRSEDFQFTEINHLKPLFGWLVPSLKNHTLQRAYRVLVGSNPDSLLKDSGDLWDTGKILSEQSINIRYSGGRLKPDKVYYWKVKTWDNHGLESDFSSIQSFKTASELIEYQDLKYSGTTRYPLQKEDHFPLTLKPLSKTHTFIDFGKASFGRLRITLFGSASVDTVMIHLGEAIREGCINRNPGGSIRYEVIKVALKAGWNTYEILLPPHYYNSRPERIIRMPGYIGKVMPFRYCEVENYPGHLLKSHRVQQITVHYPFDDTASAFFSADTLLNDLWDLCKNTIKATSFCGIYVDGDRERFPREADSYINQLSHYGVERGFSLARYTHEFQIGYSSQWTEWILHVVLSAWADYMETGDPSSMEHYYEELKAKTLIALAREDGLISTRTGKVTREVIQSVNWQEIEWRRQQTEMPAFRDIVDWPHPGRFGLDAKDAATDGFEFMDINTVVNAFHYRSLVIMREIASVLNKREDAELFQRRAELVRNSMNSILLDPATGLYRDGEGSKHSSLHSNMFPMAFGLVPEENVERVVSFIKSRGMACSPYGSLYLLESLYLAGESEYALDLLTSTGNRSWARWIYETGSTMTLEAWGLVFKPNLDWSHSWGSAPASVIPRKLMGIEVLEPGYRKIRIKPQPATLPTAQIKLPTIRGEVEVSFNNHMGSSFELKVSIPANMEAEIYLPMPGPKPKVTLNDEPVPYRTSDQFVVIENVGSGEKIFNISN